MINKREFFKEFTELIAKNYSDPFFRVENMAEHFCICTMGLRYRFKLVSLVSPYEYLVIYRLDKSYEVLKKHSVKETALLNGFVDVRYFRRRFEEHFGIYPDEFRRIFSNSESS